MIPNQNNPKRGASFAIVGHVNHGKTTILEMLIGQKIVKEESHHATQSITQYQVGASIILDTPGHDSFRSLRELVLGYTDIPILIIDNTQGIQPETKHILNYLELHPKGTIIVCLTKINLQPDILPVLDSLKYTAADPQNPDIDVHIVSTSDIDISELTSVLKEINDDYRPNDKMSPLLLNHYRVKNKGYWSELLCGGALPHLNIAYYINGKEEVCIKKLVIDNNRVMVQLSHSSTQVGILSNIQLRAPPTQNKASLFGPKMLKLALCTEDAHKLSSLKDIVSSGFQWVGYDISIAWTSIGDMRESEIAHYQHNDLIIIAGNISTLSLPNIITIPDTLDNKLLFAAIKQHIYKKIGVVIAIFNLPNVDRIVYGIRLDVGISKAQPCIINNVLMNFESIEITGKDVHLLKALPIKTDIGVQFKQLSVGIEPKIQIGDNLYITIK
jgi:small GTP-binding protein